MSIVASWVITGNFPYRATGQIIRKWLDHPREAWQPLKLEERAFQSASEEGWVIDKKLFRQNPVFRLFVEIADLDTYWFGVLKSVCLLRFCFKVGRYDLERYITTEPKLEMRLTTLFLLDPARHQWWSREIWTGPWMSDARAGKIWSRGTRETMALFMYRVVNAVGASV